MRFHFKKIVFILVIDIFITQYKIVFPLTRINLLTGIVFELSLYKKNFKSKLIQDYVNFVATPMNQKTYFKLFVFLFAIMTSSFLFFFHLKT